MRPITDYSSRMFRTICFFLAGLFCCSSPAWSASCGQKMVEDAIKDLQGVTDWVQFHRYYKQYASCDDGGIADDVTETSVHLLSKKWSQLDQLDLETKSADGFLKFVVAHIDSTADTADLKSIRSQSGRKCPQDLKSLCVQIEKAANKALR